MSASDGATTGFHNKCTLVDQSSDPAAVAAAMVLYSKGQTVYVRNAAGTILTVNTASAIPPGIITLWSGTIANIPTGWLICDGTNGTPNLLDKFVKGVPTAGTNPGTTGGNVNHTHGVGTYAVGAIGNHTHTYTPNTKTDAGGGGTTQYAANTQATTDAGGAVTPTLSGASAATDGRPPYYEVAFIYKQ